MKPENKFDAAITKDEMIRIDGNMGSRDVGITRRVGLAVLTRSYRELMDSIIKDSEVTDAFIESAEKLQDYLELLDAQRDAMREAHARLLMVLNDVYKETSSTRH